MLRIVIFLGFIFLWIPGFSQCEYSAIHHTPFLILPTGDTLNKNDENGYYQGMHVYTENDTSYILNNDTIAWMRGRYEHGMPQGKWTIHCKNGEYAIGYFDGGKMELVDDLHGHTETKMQGLNGKMGIWEYFRKDSTLIKTLRFEKKRLHYGGVSRIYQKNDKGRFILIKYEYWKAHLNHGEYDPEYPEDQTEKVFSPDGKPQLIHISNRWINTTRTYYPGGRLQYAWKCVKFLGRPTHTLLIRNYSEDGKLIEKRREKCDELKKGPVKR